MEVPHPDGSEQRVPGRPSLAELLGQRDDRSVLIGEALVRWSRQREEAGRVLRVAREEERWWMLTTPLEGPAGGTIGCLVPSRDLAARLRTVTGPYTDTLFAAVGLAVLGLVRLAFAYRRRRLELEGGRGRLQDSEDGLQVLVRGSEKRTRLRGATPREAR
jgi:hypothetical protein